ncbi:MAG: hypothetical protein A3G33_01830 [Omnitrophica bacterium RIFCSPLOWO2_12_FULL_44_17]|uniref:Diguanylate cyclase n=1 Tax=Candidatus Danuiimicrobium aquiferis TaxID=1801832 RepID=A0A1G1KVE1_9BACT|nr:MAG: hypothetical protein A3B72_01060 [Omnitrophica bacterium RIFCSPHIGHO2_02_FULL_45_28]OGW91734.1 MAG: hypothetical protein A3E74_06780 [Omnitrophica bacterium RIFCSPHIGHO2_12_FULL_44_12]OGW96850.1 MAG: hypothetical protein A3G33_01830 [Omnitrophica bacterium RIFCSPLOWO2_12_FULL_44_17]
MAQKELFNVLLIEDNPQDARLLSELLQHDDSVFPPFHLECVNRLATAIDRLKTGATFDIILVDFTLPDSHGIETFSKIVEYAPSLPIVVVTGLNDKMIALEAMRQGAQDYLVKGEMDGKYLARVMRYAIERKELEQKIVRHEKNFRKMANTAPAMLWISGWDGNFTFFNQQWLDFTGRILDQDSGVGWFECIHAEDSKSIQEAYWAAFHERAGLRAEFRLRRFDGIYCWMLATGAPSFSEDGAFTGFIGSCIDITELKQSEKELKYRLEFEKLIASISTHFINLKSDEIEKGLNLALQIIGEFTGVDRSYIFQFSENRETMTNTQEWCRAGIEPQIQNLQSISTKLYEWFMDQICNFKSIYVPKVEELPAEAGELKKELERENVCSMICAPLVRSGAVVGFLGFDAVRHPSTWTDDVISLLRIVGEMFVNALERKRNEEALRQGEERLRMFIEHAPAAIAMFDREMKYMVVSHRWVSDFNIDSEDLIGRSFYEVFPEIPERWKEIHQRCLLGAVEKCEEDIFEHANGTADWLEWEMHPWRSATGEIGGVVMFTEVITKRKQTEAVIVESERRLRSYFNLSLIGIAIISPMKGWVEVNDKLCEILGYSHDELKKMTWVELTYPEDLVEDLKQFELLLSGRIDSYSIEKRFVRKDDKVVYAKTDVQCVRKADGSVNYFIAVVEDITAKVEVEQEYVKTEEKYRSLYNSSRDGILFVDMAGKILESNPAFLNMIGYSAEELKKIHYQKLTPASWRDLEDNIMKNQILKRGYSDIYEREYIRKEGSVFPATINSWMARDKEGNPFGIWFTVRDVSERKKVQEQLRHLVYHDVLTDLPNRTLFIDRVDRAIVAARYNQKLVSVLFLGVDHFKKINDTLGHAVGDRLLQAVSGRLRGYLQETETVTRIGGDEFSILLPSVDRLEDAIKIAEKLLRAMQIPFLIRGHELYLSCSIGLSFYPNDGEKPDLLLRNADSAMERAKTLGRNNYQLYSALMNAKALERLALENGLRHALERKEFCVHYQPQVDIQTGKIIGMEALIRWQHPDLGLLSPAEFLNLAEETGLIVDMDEWVLKEACNQNRQWQIAGFTPVRVSVNLTARQFQQKDIFKSIEGILQATGLPAEFLELELTEGSIMQNLEETTQILQKLSDLGVKISIDDFGTGYSSLSHLRKFPINSLKIDQSFVRDIPVNLEDTAIVKAIISMAHSLNLEVVAESVETEAQLDFLRTENCDKMQGFLYSKPISADKFTELLISEKNG